LIQDNDLDDVATNNQLLIESPTIPAQFTIDVYKPFSDYLKLKYGENEDEINNNRQKETDYIFSLGIVKAKEKLEFDMYPILFKGKKPRGDVMNRLVSIAKEFQSYPEYPIIKSMSITNTIDRILDSKDKRTKKDYHKCIQVYVGLPKELGNTDVSEFVNRITKAFLDTTLSTTSFQEQSVKLNDYT